MMSVNAILPLLPARISEQFSKIDAESICEIHLLSERPMTLTISDKTVPFGSALTQEEINHTLNNLCRGSLHSYEDTLKNGYIPLGNGCRAGVCGDFSSGTLTSVTSIRIRIPRNVFGTSGTLVKRLISDPSGRLIYSPPGGGKTTLLRDIASSLSSPPYFKRVSVIDSRNEIFRSDAFGRSCADIYCGYDKAKGIELSVRTMSPQYIICDELGVSDAQALLENQSFGVPTVATVHSPSLERLLSREIFKKLDRAGIFSTYVGISREGRGFSMNITQRKE